LCRYYVKCRNERVCFDFQEEEQKIDFLVVFLQRPNRCSSIKKIEKKIVVEAERIENSINMKQPWQRIQTRIKPWKLKPTSWLSSSPSFFCGIGLQNIRS